MTRKRLPHFVGDGHARPIPQVPTNYFALVESKNCFGYFSVTGRQACLLGTGMPVPYIVPYFIGGDMNAEQYRKPNRCKYYNYSQCGLYFITICVQDKESIFGETINEEVILNQFGKIAEACWKEIPMHCADCELDEYIIMPNHMHGIIFINNVGDAHARPNPNPSENRSKERLPIIVGAYKSGVSKQIHQSGYNKFRWQRSYYDRIIRNENELNEIRKYIKYNHLKTP